MLEDDECVPSPLPLLHSTSVDGRTEYAAFDPTETTVKAVLLSDGEVRGLAEVGWSGEEEQRLWQDTPTLFVEAGQMDLRTALQVNLETKSTLKSARHWGASAVQVCYYCMNKRSG